MKCLWRATITCLLSLASAVCVSAQPDLRAARAAGPLTVYPDDRRAGLFYYPPGELTLAKTDGEKPHFRFLQMRYAGNVSGGDSGTIVHRSLLSFRVVMDGPTPAQVQAARSALVAAAPGRAVELRPLPIRRAEAALVYAPLVTPDLSTAPVVAPTGAVTPPPSERRLSGGHFETTGDETADEEAGGYWQERVYTLSLDADTAQVFRDALLRGQIVVSLGYAFYAEGVGPESPLEELAGSAELVAELRRRLAERNAADAPASQSRPSSHPVRAGATALTVDARRWPDLIRRVDIDQHNAPPGYAVLDVYCYDFNNALRDGLYEKQVEIEARGVTGRPVKVLTAFSRSRPDLYARTLRFPVAVRLDRPYRYRTREVDEMGETRVSAWTERPSWTAILDVTAQAETPSPDASVREQTSSGEVR